VNLLRLDARRLEFASADASEGVFARFVGGALAREGEPGIGLGQSGSGRSWTIGPSGDGVAGEALGPDAAVMRGAGIDADGFLVLAVADRALPGLVWKALDLAGCGPERIALPASTLALPSGEGAAGESIAPSARPSLSLVTRPWVMARRIFPEVAPVRPSVWQPAQRVRVRYTFNPERQGTMQVHLAGRRALVLPVRGAVARPNAPAVP
jgi:hypothetical protein